MGLLSIIQALQGLWVIFIVVMLFWRFRIGVAGYLAYIFLVPYMRIGIGGFTLQWNLINIILLFAFFLYREQHHDENSELDWRPLLPFAIYFGVSLMLMPFQDGMPFGEAMNNWRMQVMKYLVLPFVIWNDIINSYDSLKLYRNVTIGCIVIAVLYGLFLTTMPGINPYMIIVSLANGEEFNLAYAAGNGGLGGDTTLNEGRLFGRISSVFAHPMTFGLFLGLALIFLYRNKDNISMWFIYALSLFILTDIIVCGVRSAIGAISIAFLFLLLQSRNLKIFLAMVLGGGLLWVLVSHIPSLHNYLGSIVDAQSSNTSGSSIDLRLSQLEGCFQEIKDSILEGKGFGWTGYYISQHDVHPTILYFESLIYVILCNSGIIGVVLWIIMAVKIIQYNQWSDRPIAALLNSLFIFYIAYACITGEYGYMQYFIIFYILMLSEDLYDKKTELIEEDFYENKELSCIA